MLQIAPVIEQAEEIARRVERELPGHRGLLRTTRLTADAAREAQRVSQRLGRPIGLHRLPAAFLALTLVVLGGWVWWHFLRTATITIAISDSDAVDLGHQLDRRVTFARLSTPGSRESLARLRAGEADLAFVQGGVPIPAELPRVELPASELALLFLRERVGRMADIRTILTSTRGQGSHSLALLLTRFWRIDRTVRFVHAWSALVANPAYRVPDSVDAVFVVKDPMDERIARAARRLTESGFRLAPVDLGAAALGTRDLVPIQLSVGYLDPVAAIPPSSLATYAVRTYLVARPDASPRQLAATRRLVDPSANVFDGHGSLSSLDEASDLLQGVEAFLGILVYVGLAFVALLGVDIVVYRKRFHDLNSLISLVSMHQAGKDVLDPDPARKAHDIAYLCFCSDVLGLISAITGYYAQENSSLLYNKLLEIIPQRCDGLKINIQLKIMHAVIELPPGSPSAAPPAPVPSPAAAPVDAPAT